MMLTLMQECLTKIDNLARFSGPEQDATLQVDEILLQITDIENSVRLRRLEGDISDESEFLRQLDQFELMKLKLRQAQLDARNLRSQKWFNRREAFATNRPRPTAANLDVKSLDTTTDEEFNPSLSASEQVSVNLRRIHQLAQAEVLRSELNIEELDSSTKALENVSNQYSGVDLLLNGSRRLVRVLDEADAKDRRSMQLALLFLGAVLVWIVYRRILKLPIKLFIWTLMRCLGIVRFFVPQSSATTVDDASLSAVDAVSSGSTLDDLTSLNSLVTASLSAVTQSAVESAIESVHPEL